MYDSKLDKFNGQIDILIEKINKETYRHGVTTFVLAGVVEELRRAINDLH